MKLTLSRTARINDSVEIEDKISLEDDSPLVTQYKVSKSNEAVDSFDMPPDSLGGFVRTISSNIEITFPLIEKLCREIFSNEDESESAK